MVAFKKLALLGITSTIISAVCGIPVADSSVDTSVLSARFTGVSNGEASERRVPEALVHTSTEVLDSRASGRLKMRLWWTQPGQVVFMLGRNLGNLNLPQELKDLVAGHMEGTPGQMLFMNFMTWCQQRHSDVHEWLTDQLPELNAIQMGGMWGTGYRDGDYGFGISITGGWTNSGAGAQLLQKTVDAIKEWSGGDSGQIAVSKRGGNFFNPAEIGAGQAKMIKKSRTGQCPNKDYDVLSIANQEVPDDIDFKKYYRWAGQCN